MKRVWEEGLVEAEAESGPAAHGRHREDEVRSGAEAGAEDAQSPPGEAQLCNVDGVVGDVGRLEEVCEEGLDDRVCCSCERAVPCFPRWVWVIGWEVVHYVGGEEVGDFLEEA